MSRVKLTTEPIKEKLTTGRIKDFACKLGSAQTFLWDTEAKGLAVRATRNGAKAFVFQGKLKDKTIRITIGDVETWDIEGEVKDASGRLVKWGARQEARRLQILIDQKIDPRRARAEEVKAAEDKLQEERRQQEENARKQALVSSAWNAYVAARTPRWGSRNLADHLNLACTGGKGERGQDLKPGALAALMPLRLSDLTQERVQKWLEWETSTRPTQAALAFRLLRAFINWCHEDKDFTGMVDPAACTAKSTREALPKKTAKADSLQREQLAYWFAEVRKIRNPAIGTYLQGLLITGARREELANLKWTDVDLQWNSLLIRDKVEGERTIPLTPYFRSLLLELKRINETPPPVTALREERQAKEKPWQPSPWVFASRTASSGRLQEPSIQHRKACAAAGIQGLTLHGLRRSFKSLSEWVEIPAGIVAQIMGHKPSATAEKHYTVRPLDLLRVWHTKIEDWILAQAGIQIENPAQQSKGVRRVK